MSFDSVKMRLTNFFTKNIGLKLVSIISAILLWLVVINITDPVVTDTRKNIPVSLLNQEVITSSGKTLEVVNGSDVLASVVIKAPRSVIREIGDDSLKAVADMRYLSEDESTVPIIFSVTKYSDKVESISASADSIQVRVENKRTVQLPISATTSGDIESGYVIGNITQAQNQVKISGPASIISSISRANVDVQVTGFKENISTSADIVLYDNEGNEVDDKNLEMNLNSVRVEVEILATKKVPLVVSSTGTPAEGYNVTGVVECDVENVVIAATPSVIDKVEKIVIPESQLNVSGLSSSLKAVIDIANFLPSGVRLADSNFSGYANVTVYIEQYQEQTISAFLRNIEVINIPEGFSATEWEDENGYVEFVVVGLAQDLEKIQMSQLNFTVDFSDYELMHDIRGFRAGKYDLPLLMDLPENVWIKEPVEVTVILKK
ncbi:MAG: CdaR family protein [Lachnospiraceae bacterium]|nr:CdaR family protein [Lachnospiraceae bacterium]